MGELVARLLQKNKWKPKALDQEDSEPFATKYEVWNETLAKKFAVMFKNYKKFE